MKTLLEFVLRYADFLYLNPTYRITDSRTRGLADIDASISFTGEVLRWDLVNDRGQIYFTGAPTHQGSAHNWFAVSLIRQYLEGGEDTGAAAPVDQANWLGANLVRIEQLFADEATSLRICEELAALRRSNSSKKWGWPKPGHS